MKRLWLFQSILGRLLIASMLLLPVLVGLTGVGLDRAFQLSALAAEKSRLTAQVYLLLAAADVEEGQVVMPKVFTEPLFSQPGSGLYGFVHEDEKGVLAAENERWRSSSAQWVNIQELGLDSPYALSNKLIEFSQINQFFVLHYRVRWELDGKSQLPLVFTVYQDRSAFLAGQSVFRAQIIQWLVTIALATLLLQSVLLLWGLRPLRGLTKTVAAFTRGETASVEGQFPWELRALTENLNSLLSSEKQLRERYRNTLSDLAHSLKTPLAVVRNELREVTPDMNVLREHMQRMQDIVAHQLQRAQIASSDHLEWIEVGAIAGRIITSLKKLYPSLSFELSQASLKLRLDEKDLFELLGNTLENACKYGANNIAVGFAEVAHRGLPHAVIRIDDNGPGVPADKRESIVTRGQRVDEQQSGQGLGLALVQDIVMAYGGELRLATSHLGGLQVQLLLPMPSKYAT